MSTTQPPVVISSTLPSPSTTPTAEAPTLLFGFLVSTLSFFTVFMTLAIVWNRLAVRRHAIDAMLAMSPSLESWGPRQPIMWDIWTMPDKQPSPWLDIKVSGSLGCSRELANNQPAFFDSLWQPKDLTALQVHLGLCRRSKPYRSGDVIY